MTNLSEKQVYSMITYWIELRHIDASIDNMVEETDEIGEIYEKQNWLNNNQSGEECSIMDVHVLLEEALDKSNELVSFVEDSIPEVLRICYKTCPGKIFGNYAGQLSDVQLEEVIARIVDIDSDVYDIYDYSTDIQLENFCELVNEYCAEVLG